MNRGALLLLRFLNERNLLQADLPKMVDVSQPALSNYALCRSLPMPPAARLLREMSDGFVTMESWAYPMSKAEQKEWEMLLLKTSPKKEAHARNRAAKPLDSKPKVSPRRRAA